MTTLDPTTNQTGRANQVSEVPEGSIWIASFDIGKKNFAFCIEEIKVDELNEIRGHKNKSESDDRTKKEKIERYYKDGTATAEFNNVLHQVYRSGHLILLDNVDLTYNCDNDQYIDPRLFVNMNHELGKYKDYWNKCTSIIIEQQMGFGKKRNYMALKLGQHCFSYFVFHYSNFKTIIEFPSYHKTKVLGAPKKISKYQRKIWAVQKAMEIMACRMDVSETEEEFEKLVLSRRKADDMSDVIAQLQAFKFLTFVDKNI